jgi:hypothetical protein
MPAIAQQVPPARLEGRIPADLRLLLAIWLISAVMLSALHAFGRGWQPADPDDFMRMLQVRDLLAGQSWFDVRQYRMDPPVGADMHWSRLVDVPILALRLLFGVALSPSAAEAATMIAVPLLYLLAAQAMLVSIARRLGLPAKAALGTALLVPLFPLLASNFAPFRIDHHTPQLLAALACAGMLLKAPCRRAAVASGVIAAVWLTISLEGIPLVAALAAIYGLRYALCDDRSLPWFLAALSGGSLMLGVATRPWSELAGGACDVVQFGHVAAFGAGAGLAALLPHLPLQATRLGRTGALVLLPLVCVPIVLTSIGACAVDPYRELGPTVRRWWFEFVLEGMPIWRQVLSVSAMLVWTPVLVLAGAIVARRESDPRVHERWATLALLALAACLVSFFVMRAALIAQILCLPFAALLLWRFLPRARAIGSTVPRILATLACILLATPTGPSALAKPFNELAVPDARLLLAARMVDPRECDYRSLADLPATLIFAPLDRGPEIVMRTPHRVVMSGYHRNAARMRDVIDAFGGDLRGAEGRVRASGASYLLICASSMDLAMYRTRRPDNLVNALANGRTPAWLEPVQGFDAGPLRVYRLRR